MATEAALANAQSTTWLVLIADGARVDWGHGQFYTAKLVHLSFRRILLAVSNALKNQTIRYNYYIVCGTEIPAVPWYEKAVDFGAKWLMTLV